MRLGLRLKKQRRKRVRERTTIKSASSCGGAAMAELGCAHGARLCKAPQAHGEKTAGQHALGARNGAGARAALRRLCGKGYLALRPRCGRGLAPSAAQVQGGAAHAGERSGARRAACGAKGTHTAVTRSALQHALRCPSGN